MTSPEAGTAGGAGPPRGRRRRERKAVLLRLDPELHDVLARWAADDLRSTNGHIEWLLRQAVTAAGRSPANPSGTAPVPEVAAEDG